MQLTAERGIAVWVPSCSYATCKKEIMAKIMVLPNLLFDQHIADQP